MKKAILLAVVLTTASFCFGQNLIVNGDFETGMLAPNWGGFNNQILTDDLTSSKVGNGNNAEASIFQEFAVTPGETYNVTFQYRWVSGTSSYNCTVRVKDAKNLPTNLDLVAATGTSDGYKLKDTADVWYNAAFTFTPPTGVESVRLLFYKANGNRPLRMDNVSVVKSTVSSVNALTEFDFQVFPNPTTDVLLLSAAKAIDQVEIYNINGQQLMRQPINSQRAEVDVSRLPQGTFIVKAFIDGAVGAYKMVKE